jgi:hypothetical protein
MKVVPLIKSFKTIFYFKFLEHRKTNFEVKQNQSSLKEFKKIML